MNWQNFFQLKVMQKIGDKEIPYFCDELKVGLDFSLSELHLREFMDLRLSERELKNFSLTHRKIYLRLEAFHSREFKRIVENFISRLRSEKKNELIFSTSGGGIYLFMHLMRYENDFLHKRIFCRTSEIPFLEAKGFRPIPGLKLEYRPDNRSFFDPFPTLWENSPQLILFEVDETESETA
jgi:hypothetical protein